MITWLQSGSTRWWNWYAEIKWVVSMWYCEDSSYLRRSISLTTRFLEMQQPLLHKIVGLLFRIDFEGTRHQIERYSCLTITWLISRRAVLWNDNSIYSSQMNTLNEFTMQLPFIIRMVIGPTIQIGCRQITQLWTNTHISKHKHLSTHGLPDAHTRTLARPLTQALMLLSSHVRSFAIV